jgi:molybdenum cofactor biosynthesis enzyme MoaA
MIPVNLGEYMKEFKVNYHYLNECDMKCKFCFGKMNKGFNEQGVIETFKSICKITNSVNLAGGEIFLYIDLLKKLIEIAVRNKVQVSFISNGFILINNLEDDRVDYIIRNVKLIGVSIDSFIAKTNLETGRNSNRNFVNQENMIKLRKKCSKYRTKLKINTVITQSNLNEEIGNKILTISPDKWKIIQVVSADMNVKVSKDEFLGFIDKNQLNNIVDIEFAKCMRKSYIMINNEGILYYNGKHIGSVNVNDIVTNNKKNFSEIFLDTLVKNNIDVSLYLNRYDMQDINLYFSKSKYAKKISSVFDKVKGNILFLDVESVTPRYKGNTKKYVKYTASQLHFLYTGLVINQNFEVQKQIFDWIPPHVDIRENTNSNSDVYVKFYLNFFDMIMKNKIRKIVVSGIDTERNFLEDCLYYISSKISRKEYEKIQSLLNNLLDIQVVKTSNIIESNNNSCASRRILESLHQSRPDLFLYTRSIFKDSESSFDICKVLIDIYFEGFKQNEIFLNKCIEMVKEYCLDDVYDDFELAYIYEGIMHTSIENDRKGVTDGEVQRIKAYSL